jgi:hypothetical protein
VSSKEILKVVVISGSSSTIKSRPFFASVFVGDRVSGSDEIFYDRNTITQTSLKCYVDNLDLIFLSRHLTLHIVTFAIVTAGGNKHGIMIPELLLGAGLLRPINIRLKNTKEF